MPDQLQREEILQFLKEQEDEALLSGILFRTLRSVPLMNMRNLGEDTDRAETLFDFRVLSAAWVNISVDHARQDSQRIVNDLGRRQPAIEFDLESTYLKGGFGDTTADLTEVLIGGTAIAMSRRFGVDLGALAALAFDVRTQAEVPGVHSLASFLSTDKRRPIWPDGGFPVNFADLWSSMKQTLLACNEDWHVWTEWYEARLRGDDFDPALELKRILIPDKEWKEGPAHVNALIAEMIREHEASAVEQDVAPETPAERPSPLLVEMRDGRLSLVHRPEAPDEALKTAWQGLREMLEDFDQGGAARNTPKLRVVVTRCMSAIGRDYELLDVVRLGQHGSRLDGYAKRADDILMGEDAADLIALSAQVKLFLAQFESWSTYANSLQTAFDSDANEANAVSIAAEVIDEIKVQAPDLIAAEVQEPLDALQDEAAAEPSIDGDVLAPPLARRGFLRAVRSSLIAFMADALAVTRSLAVKATGTVVFTAGSGYVLASLEKSAGLLTKLSQALPSEFGFLADLAQYLLRLPGL